MSTRVAIVLALVLVGCGGGTTSVSSEAGALLPTTTVPRLPADCGGESVREAVEREVDGGLEFELLACDGTWLAVNTFSNPCPATGDGVRPPECFGNEHVGYFRALDGVWRVIAFDDCDAVRQQRAGADLPDAICEAGRNAPDHNPG